MELRRTAIVALCGAAAIGAAPPPPLLSSDDFDPAMVLPAPPDAGSAQASAERAELLAMDRARTPAMLAAARHDSETKNASIFAEAIGPRFDLEELPATAKLMAEVRVVEKDAADRAKAHFRRNRPWVLQPKLHHCGKDDDAAWSSYPSGHTTMAFSMAAVLARLELGHATSILNRAAQYGQSRVVCEVHWRSDVAAGQMLGLIVAERLMANAEFRGMFETARKELAEANVR